MTGTGRALLIAILMGSGALALLRLSRSPVQSPPAVYVPRPAGRLTFAKDVAPIVYRRCAGCHRPGEAAPFPLLSYEDVRTHAAQISDVVEHRIMPPWLPDPSVVSFADQRVLTVEEIGIICQWASEGAAPGDLAAAPSPPHWTTGWKLGEPDLVLEMPEAFTLPADGSDVYRNFVIPVPENELRYVRAVEIRPGNPRIIHHGVMLVDSTSESRRLDRRDEEPGYGGFVYGSTAHSPDGHFIGWTPGKSPFQAPPGMAWRLEPGTDVVLQLHMVPSGKHETIRAQIGLYFTDIPPQRTPLMVRLGSLEIDIPAGEREYLIEDEFRLPVDVQVLGVYPHAHYLARTITGVARLPDGEERPLIRINEWNFNWQDEYRYEEPLRLPRGTVLRMQYTYDNSADNPMNPHTPPRRVLWGPKSSNEMGDLWIQVLPENPNELITLRRVYQRREFEVRLSSFEHAVRINPDDLEAHYNLGSLLEQKGDLKTAEHHYREALRVEPQHAQSLNNLGVLLCRRGELAQGVHLFEQALAIDPDYEDARINLAQARGLLSQD